MRRGSEVISVEEVEALSLTGDGVEGQTGRHTLLQADRHYFCLLNLPSTFKRVVSVNMKYKVIMTHALSQIEYNQMKPE